MRVWIGGLASVGVIAVVAAGFVVASEPEGPGPATGAARSYLSDALDLLRENHLNSADADWPALEQAAFAAADGARTTAETWPAIRLVLERLGEKHSVLQEPPEPRPTPVEGAPAAPAKPRPQPEGRLVDGRFGHVTVTQFGGSRERGLPYANRLRGFISEFEQAGACGWIVDLRGNGGGNVWPMLDGVGPLLGGEGKVLSFDITGQGVYDVIYQDGVAVQGESWTTPEAPDGPHQLRNPLAPVAILTDGGTASSAEALAIAFAGRPNVRSFGAATANYVSVNNVFPLSDDAHLIVTMGWNRDRTGRVYRDALRPDEIVGTEGDAPVRAAAAWLAEQPACLR